MNRAGAALSAAFLTACATASVPPNTPPAAEDVALGEGDVVEIKVFREPDLAGVYRVGQNGDIDFPFIGKVRLLGKDPYTVEEEIRTRLSDGYLKQPQVTVFLRDRNSQKIHVLGQVAKPVSVTYEAGMTVIQAIAVAGGFHEYAATNSVRVTRQNPSGGGEQMIVLPVGDIQAGRAPNFDLKPGDIVYVPEAIF